MKKIFKDSSLMFISTILTALSFFISDIFIRNILGPSEYGIWLTISLILVYGQVLQFGLVNAMNKEVPKLLGERDFSGAKKTYSVVLGAMILPFIFSVILIIITWVIKIEIHLKVFISLALILVPLQQSMNYYRITYLTKDNFRHVAINQLLIGPVQSILSLLFVFLFGFIGMFIALYITCFVGLFILISRLEESIKPSFDIKLTKSLMSFGIPIMIIGISWTLFTTVDRLMISVFLGSISLGYFGISIFVFQGLMMFPQVLSQVLYPKISYAFGKSDKEKLEKLINYPSLLMTLVFPYIIVLVYYVFPLFVEYFMPDYINGINAANILVFGVYFLCVTVTYTIYLNSANLHKRYLKTLLLVICINIILNFSFIYMGYGIEHVSLGTSISNLIFMLLIVYQGLNGLGYNKKEYIRRVCIILYPFFVMLFLVFMLNNFITFTVTKLILFYIFYTLTLIIIVISLKEFSFIYNIFKLKIKIPSNIKRYK